MSIQETVGLLSDIEASAYLEWQDRILHEWEPLPHQIPPDWDWFLWLLRGGRGTGKTDAGAAWTDDHMNGPPCDTRLEGGHRMSIIAPTLGDAYESCVMGPSGLKAHNPNLTAVTRKGGTYVIWPNGAELKLFGAYTPNDVERLRAGGNRCAVWCEELAAWSQLKAAWNHMRFGLRLGPHPRVVATTTPKPRKHLQMIAADPKTAVTVSSTNDNPYLAENVRDALYDEYGDTRLGRQELGGEMLSDVPGAIATLDQLDEGRRADHPKLDRRIVMVDPAMTNTETSDECGITVQGKKDNEVYLIADLSGKMAVSAWARLAVEAALDNECGAIFYEANQGSDTNAEVIQRALDDLNEEQNRHHQIPIKPVTASMSKYDRALALQQAIEQKRYHLVGSFPKLEEELTEWTPEALDEDETSEEKKRKKDKSPNRLDAAVHGYRTLMGMSTTKGKTAGRQLRNARIG